MAPHGLIHGADDLRALGKPGAVDVVQGELRLPQHRAAQAVPQYVPGEDGTARPHKRDLFHRKILSSLLSFAGNAPPSPPLSLYLLPPRLQHGKLHKALPFPLAEVAKATEKIPLPRGEREQRFFLITVRPRPFCLLRGPAGQGLPPAPGRG